MNMNSIIPFLVDLLFLIAHFGLWVALYNRVNAFSFPRRFTKPILKVLLLLAICLPIYLLSKQGDSLGLVKYLASDFKPSFGPLRVYCLFVFSSYAWLGIPWLLSRPIFGFYSLSTSKRIKYLDLEAELNHQLFLTNRCRTFSSLPFNQIFHLSVEEIELPIPQLPASLDGYRIAHLSDIHLTGDVAPEFTRHAVDIANNWRPEMFALTGDIIDHPSCLDWLSGIFGQARASDGCYFILGNHDARMEDAKPIRRAMIDANWIDLGGKHLSKQMRGQSVTLIGNEAPWFLAPAELASSDGSFRVMLSHSPDQITWAQQNQIQLMLAGHTHGGQGRLPMLGPVLSPSVYGSRYASGQFFRQPTTMHVTRGLSGTRLMRINCPPELSLLTLRAMNS